MDSKTEIVRVNELEVGNGFIKQGVKYRVRKIDNGLLWYSPYYGKDELPKSSTSFMSHFSIEKIEKIVE